MDRIDKIKELNDLIAPLLQNKMLLEIKNQVKIINQDELQELLSINSTLKPLIDERDSLKFMYVIEYRGKLYDYKSNSHYMSDTKQDPFYLITECDIDSLDINSYNKLNFSSLIKEISEILYISRYNEFEIINIKRIK